MCIRDRLYLLAKLTVFGRILPGGGIDVFMNQAALAGWVGLFVTGLNPVSYTHLDVYKRQVPHPAHQPGVRQRR